MLRKFGRAAADILYPERCINCGRFGTMLCPACQASMEPATHGPRCPHCRALWDGEANCPRCFHLQALDGVIAAFEMAGPARKAVHAMKYQYVRAIAPLLATHIVAAAGGRRFDAVFPVPLHRSRERSRGFNQATALVAATGWAPEPGLVRVRKTDRQVGMHERQRRANVAGAFRYSGRGLTGCTVALVDDVITTGATMQECAIVLREAGAREVWAVAFARASYKVVAPDAPIED